MSENAWKSDFFHDTLKLTKLLGFRKNKGLKMKLNGKKSNFSMFFLHGLPKETKNLIRFLYECKFLSPTDKGNLKETNADFLQEISEYFVCIFS